MASNIDKKSENAETGLAKYSKLPLILIGVGAVLGLVGLAQNSERFAYSYLLAFVFFLSICLGGLFLTMIHHLFDAQWSVPFRRISEHLAFLAPVMAALFIPIALMAPTIYKWMNVLPSEDHALMAKQPIFTKPWFYLIAIVLFAVWSLLSYKLRYWSLKQDETGGADCTRKMRQFSAWGIYAFGLTLTLAAIMWIKSLEWQWFSTMYGVYYFAASVWTTLATVYLIGLVTQKYGPLTPVLRKVHFKDLGTLFFAFTVFYAYIHFSQYFLIWNAAIPEETFWYVQREKGNWWDFGMILIFGHFFLPFLALLRIDAKMTLPLMIPLCFWAWLMHFCDMAFNIMPVINPENFTPHYLDLACFAFIGGILATVFIKNFKSHAPYPVKDPRLGESLGIPQIGSEFKTVKAKTS